MNKTKTILTNCSMAVVILFASIAFAQEPMKASVPNDTIGKSSYYEIFNLQGPVACCKVNCSSLGVADCENKYERLIRTIPIKNAKKIKIEGRGTADASTNYADGKLIAIYKSSKEKATMKEIIIPARQSALIDIDFDILPSDDGQLEISIAVSDWCTIINSLSIKILK